MLRGERRARGPARWADLKAIVGGALEGGEQALQLVLAEVRRVGLHQLLERLRGEGGASGGVSASRGTPREGARSVWGGRVYAAGAGL